MKRMILLVCTFLGILAAPGFSEDAAKKLNQGVRLFESGNYEGAGKAFAEADVALPDHLTIAFARACVYAGQGDMDKAVEGFQRASLSRDQKVAVEARYNLGCISGEKARTLFGAQPENAAPEVRQEGMDLLLRAVMHYRECIELDPGHEEARHNLELARLWIKHMEALWKEKDREKAREEMDLLQFLQMIEQRQAALRNITRDLIARADSPMRRQALKEGEEEQRALVEEVDPYLKDKLKEALKPPPQQPGQPGQPAPPTGQGGMEPDQQQQALDLYLEWANEARDAMAQSGDFLIGSPEESLPYQMTALDSLDRIFAAGAPFPMVLEKALKTEQNLVDRTIPLVESPGDHEEVDYEDLAWPQKRVEGWSAVLPYKAEQGLKELEAQGGAMAQQAQPGADQEKMQEQMEGMKKAMEKAIELSPEILTLTGEAAKLLEAEDGPGALPMEEEALQLLKEIAEEMPKNDEDQQGDQNQDQQNQQDQNQQQQEQQPQDKQKQRDKEMSKEEAESILQKAKEREREHKEREEEMRKALMKRGKVEKDW